MVKSEDADAVFALECVRSCAWFNTGLFFNSAPLWKSTDPRAHLKAHAYWFLVPVKQGPDKPLALGGYCADQLFVDEKDKNKSHGESMVQARNKRKS